MIKQRWNEMTKFRKRVFALTLATAVVSTSFNVGSFVVNAGTSARGRVIVGFEELPEDIANQTIPIGAKKNDINFPDELEVVLYSEEDESEETTRERKEEKEEATEHVEKLKEETATETKEKEKSTEAPAETATETATEPVTVETGESAGQGTENGNNGSKEQGGENSDQTSAPEENNTPAENAGSTENSEPSEVTAPEPEPESGGDEGGNDEGGSDEGSAEESPEGKAYSGFVSAFSDGIKNTFSPVKAFAAEPDEGDGGAEEPEEEKEQEEPEPEAESPSEEIVVKAVGPNEEFGMEEPASEEPSSAKSESAEPASAEPASTEAASEEASEVKEETSEEPTEKAKEKEDGEETDKVSENKKEDEEKADKVKKLPDGERRVLEDVKWKLDRDKSEYGTRFQTVRAGDVFYFVPDLKPYGLKSEADLPEIKVTVVEEDESVSDNSVSDDAVSQNAISENAVSDNSVSENKFPEFDQFMIVDGVKVRVTAPEGVFPEDATLKVRKIDDAESNAKIEQAVKADMGLSDSVEVNGETSLAESEDGNDRSTAPSGESLKYISFDITINDVSGNEIQPNTENGKANVTFSQADIVADYLAAPGEETEGKLNEVTEDGEDDTGSSANGGRSGSHYVDEEGRNVYIIGDDEEGSEDGAESDVDAKKTLRVYHSDDELNNLEKLATSLDESESAVTVDADHFSPYILVDGNTGVKSEYTGDIFGDFKIECSGAKLEITLSPAGKQPTDPGIDKIDIHVIPSQTGNPDISITQQNHLGTGDGTDQTLSLSGGASGVETKINMNDHKTYNMRKTAIYISDFKGLDLTFNNVRLDFGGEGGYNALDIKKTSGKITYNKAYTSDTIKLKDSDIEICSSNDDGNEIYAYGQDSVFNAENSSMVLTGGKCYIHGKNLFRGGSMTATQKSGEFTYKTSSTIFYNPSNLDMTFNLEGGSATATDVEYVDDWGTSEIIISGGTHKVSTQFLGLAYDSINDKYDNNHLKITGGSLHIAHNVKRIQYDNNKYYYPHTIKLEKPEGTPLADNVQVTGLKFSTGSYKTTDCYTRDNGTLYFWFDGDYKLNSITAGGDEYLYAAKNPYADDADKYKYASPDRTSFFSSSYVYFTDLSLDSSQLTTEDNVLKPMLTFICSDGISYKGSEITGEHIPGVYDRLKDITWKVEGGSGTAKIKDNTNNTDNVTLTLPDVSTYKLTATLKDPVHGNRILKVFYIPQYIPVQSVELAGEVTMVSGTAYTLSGNNALGTTASVKPSNATFKEIVWSVKDPSGNPLALDTNYKFTPTVTGEYTITAAVANGKTESTPYTQDIKVKCKKALTYEMLTVAPQWNQYTGSPIKPNVLLKDGETTLKEGTDYTLTYSNNIEIGTATVTITGKGNYTGSLPRDFLIGNLPSGKITIAGQTYTTFQNSDSIGGYVKGETEATIEGTPGAGATSIYETRYYVSDKYLTEAEAEQNNDAQGWPTYQSGDVPKTSEGNNYIHALINDDKNNTIFISSKNIIQDGTPPTKPVITSAVLGGTTGTVTVTSEDAVSGIGSYYVLAVKKGSAAPDAATVTKNGVKSSTSPVNISNLSLSQVYTFYAVTVDKAGNASEISEGVDSTIKKGDINASIKVAGHSYDKIQTKKEIDVVTDKQEEITITASGNSGVKKIEYFVSDQFYSTSSAMDSGAAKSATGGWAEYDDSNKPYIERNKDNYIYVRVTTYAGTDDKPDYVYISSKGITEDDRGEIKAVISVMGKTYSQIQPKAEIDGYSKKQEEFSITASGKISVKKIEYFLSDKFYSSSSQMESGAKSSTAGAWSEYDGKSKPVLEKNKLNYIYVRVTTDAGTDTKPDYVYVSSKGIWEDEVLPEISKVTVSLNETSATVKVTGTDKESGVKNYYLLVKKRGEAAPSKKEIMAGGQKNTSGSFTVSNLEKGVPVVFYTIVEDKAGNVSAITKWEDKIPPVISKLAVTTTDTTAKVTVTATDAESGISTYYLMVKKHGEKAPTAEEIMKSGANNTTGSFTVEKLTKGDTYDFYTVVTDKAGNVSDIKSTSVVAGGMSAKIEVDDDHSYDVLQGREVVEDFYYKEPKEIKITAKGASKIEYFITNKFYSSTTELENAVDPKSTKTSNTTQNSGTEVTSSASKWSTYNDDSRPYLKKNLLNYIYAKITDASGNVLYISSKGIWEDEIKPTVTSVKATPKDKSSEVLVKGKDNESGIKYYYLVAKKATEDAPGKADDVKSAGIRSEDGKYKVESLTPNTKYVLYAVIEDKAENLSEIKKSNFTTKKDSTSANKAGAKAAGAGAGGSGSGGSGSNVDKRTAGAKDTPSGNDSGKGEAVRDGVPYIEDASDGILIGREKTSGWDRIEGEVGKASAPAQVFINMNGSTDVPADAFKQCEGRDVTYYFDINDDITWVVNGLSFTQPPQNIDFRVRTDTKNIPSKLINEVADVYPHTELTLEHDGEFGFTAILSLNVGKDNMGMFANLYFYNEDDNSLEFIDSVEVDGSGRASFKFLHASDYTVILRGDALTDKTAGLLTDDIAAGSTSSTTTGPANVSRITGKVWLIIVSIISFLLCGLILFMPDKKKRRSYARTR